MDFVDKTFEMLKMQERERYYLTPRAKSTSTPGSTPSPLPQPFSKRVLTADQKMTRTLQSAGLSSDEIQRIKEAREQELQAKAAVKAKREQEKLERELKKKQKAEAAQQAHNTTMELRKCLAKECLDIGQPGGPEAVRLIGDGQDVVPPEQPKVKAAKSRSGPMTAALEQFVKDRKAEGLNYMQAMGMWRDSAERAAIVNQMTPAERKKRKYDLVRPQEPVPVPAELPAPGGPGGARMNEGAA